MKVLAAIMLMMAVFCAVGCKKEGDGTINGHHYVDLGLPSGTLWAICNVGADNSEDYGDYFAWSETEPKECYDWNTYKYCNDNEYQLTKYCNRSDYGYNGFADNLTVLGSTDDAATAIWGNGWRMPTKAEWEELENNTTCIWTTRNGVHGRLFTATNGNTIFLPGAGFRWNENVYGVDYYGESYYGGYWSSSLGTDYPNYAWYFDFDSDSYRMSTNQRFRGHSVRPVCSAAKN